jgi:hypothetical protein
MRGRPGGEAGQRVLEELPVVALGKVEPLVRAARLGCARRALRHRLGAVEHRAELERLQQVGVVDVGLVVQLDAGVALAQLGELRAGRGERLAVR